MLGNNHAVSGRYKGEPLDDSSRRSIAIRRPAPTDDQPADACVVDYFYHDGTFWTCVFPLDGVDQIMGQAFNFSKPKTRRGPQGPEIIYDSFGAPRRRFFFMNHVQTRFRLKPGQTVDLYPLHSDLQVEPSARVDDFVYSVEAIGPSGVNFGVWDGLNGSLISAHRFLSTEEMVFERIVVEGQYVAESPPLPLDAAHKRALLAASLERSDRAGMSETYYLYRVCGTNNCTSSPFQLLDKTVDYSWRQKVGATLYRLPWRPRFYLRVRGMDSDPTYRKLVRSEFADFMKAPATQQRKRAYVKTKIRALRAARAERAE